MYSNSQSYLGGANAPRPGQSPYGQQAFGQQQYGMPPSTGSFPQQPTGYVGQPGMQPQPTGYPTQPLQFQTTGFPQQNVQQFQQPQRPPLPQMPSSQQTPAQPQRIQPQPTSMTSAQMANSFRSSPAQTSQQEPPPSSGPRIPNMRLSFITAKDQANFEQLFKSACGSSRALTGDQARELLLRSKLAGETLSRIWTLADTTKSGQLLFPEFALAMYLCNLSLTGKSLPATLPENIRNEVSSMVDIISFAVPDDRSDTPRSNVPSFDEPLQKSSVAAPPVQQPQPQQPTNTQLLSQLVSQPTGFFQAQIQPSGLTPQQTSYPSGLQPTSAYTGPRPLLPPMPTGFQQQQTIPLNAQPTGRPGQWGLVNAPASGLPNLEALRVQMMPQPGRESGFSATGLRGNATVPWAVTKDEKKIYDEMFKTWDGFGKGFITGNQAIEIFGQSGLDKSDLEKIWTLSDPSNKGRLDLDEFAVAMHLIYRRLNGYPVPNRLPPELVPPSTRYLNDSLGSIKSLLSRDAEERKSSGAFLQPQKTGVSYLKNHSFRDVNGNSTGFGRKDATVYKNNDEEFGYRSSARHRVGAGERSASPAQSLTPPSEAADDLSIEQLQKKIREKQVLLDAIDFQDENQSDQDEALDRKDKRDAEELYRRIRNMQDDIDRHPNATFRGGDSSAERRTMHRQLQSLTDRLPDIASRVRQAERAIAEARLEVFRLSDAKEHPNSANAIVGTGPGGSVTESDRLKARAKLLMEQRSAALAGRPVPSGGDDSAAATRRFDEENTKVTTERENNDRMVRDVEESVRTYSKSVEDSLKEGSEDSSREHEKRRWEDGLGVEDEVRDFIFDLQRSSRTARVRREDTVTESQSRGTTLRSPPSAEASKPTARAESPKVESPRVGTQRTESPASYASYKTPEERAAYIKQQAEQKMAERLAALGLRAPAKSSATQQKQEQEKKDREEKLKQAEAEDSRREQERQQRLADEQISPPTSKSAKAPPPPPSRRGGADSTQKQADAESKRASQVIAEQAIKEQQQAQQMQTQALEDEEHRQVEELRRQQDASEARRKALEEQVRLGKVKKDEEKRRRKAAEREQKEKEARLAAQRAELEVAREREKELQRQLEALNDEDSSDDEGPQQATPNYSTPAASQELSRSVGPTSPPPTSAPIERTPEPQSPMQSLTVASPPTAESKNPYFKQRQVQETAPLTSPPPVADNNPFHRLSMQPSQQAETPLTSGSRTARPRDEDDWSAVDESAEEDDEADQPSGAGNAKQLASILFGTMGPPRPLSSLENRTATPSTPGVSSPPPTADAISSPPPAPPPMPPSTAGGGPPAAPPPPPPMPGTLPSSPPPAPPPMPPGAAVGSPPPPPPMPTMRSGTEAPNRGALLGQIQMGKALKKTETKDRSTSASAGRVL